MAFLSQTAFKAVPYMGLPFAKAYSFSSQVRDCQMGFLLLGFHLGQVVELFKDFPWCNFLSWLFGQAPTTELLA